MKTIKVLSDFCSSPGPRYCKQGAHSGEEFYHQILNPKFAEAFNNHEELTLDLDGTDGYMSSFIDEAVGNLVFDFGKDAVSKYLHVVSNEEKVWITLIKENVIPEWDKRRRDNEKPKKTSKLNHDAWYKLKDGVVEKGVWIYSSNK